MNPNETKQDSIIEPYKVIADNMISVCSNCYPGRTIEKLFPDLAGVEISHGICAGHKAEMRLEITRVTARMAKAALQKTI